MEKEGEKGGRRKKWKEKAGKRKKKERKLKLKTSYKKQGKNFACGTYLKFAMGKRIQLKILGGGEEIKLYTPLHLVH